MWISDLAIRRPVVTIVVMLALVTFGLFSLARLDTDEFPEIDPPIVSITLIYPGASPEVVEQEVVEPIEEAIASISGIDRITSQSLDGFALIIAEFVFEKDVQEAVQDARDQISQIRGELPPELEEPVYARFDPADLPIVSLALASREVSRSELTSFADQQIIPQLRGIAGVAEAEVVGGLERELVVEIDPAAMQASGIGVGQIVQALQAQNLAAPIGRLEQGSQERTIRLLGRLDSIRDFEQLIIPGAPGIVRLGEVADVRDGAEEQRTLAFIDGEPAVGIDVTKAQGYSTTAVAEALLDQVERIRATLPPGIDVRVIRNAGERVQASVDSVTNSLIEGALLTVITVFLFLNSWRSTVITGLALPVSLISSFIAVLAFGFTLNTMSLLGLALAIGILIDDAIVVRENIVRHVEMGKDHFTASREGTAEIGLAVAATTFSIVVVFIPIAFIGGLTGQWFRPFALTIACSVLVSLFVSFSLDPMLSAYWPDPHREEHEKAWITRKLDAFNRWFERMADRYKNVVAWALDHRLAVSLIATAAFVGAIAMPALGIVGGSFFPVTDSSEFYLTIDTPPGSSLAYTAEKTETAARVARAYPEVEYTYTTVGGASGAVDEGSVFVKLTGKGERKREQAAIEGALREQLREIGGAEIGITAGGGPGGGQKSIQLQVQGPDVNVLTRLSEQIAAGVEKIPGAVDVALSTEGRKPEVQVTIDRALAGRLGISVGEIAQALRPAFGGIEAGDWVDPSGENRDVTVRLPAEGRRSVADLASLPLTLSRGPGGGEADRTASIIPVGQVATIEEQMGPARIDRTDRERVITVGANVQDRPLSEVVAEIETVLAGIQMPPGYEVSQGGDVDAQQEVFGEILFALGTAVLLMYFVLVLQFGSFLDPFAIMLSLPLSLIGVVLALWITGDTLNLMSLIGVILLMGLVAKNAILLIDFAKWSIEEGMPMREALIEAGRIRLRPIVMTSIALIMGMLPVAIGAGEGADFRAPLGRAVIGGVITSTVLTLLVIPTVYEMLAGGREWFVRMLRRVTSRGSRTSNGERA